MIDASLASRITRRSHKGRRARGQAGSASTALVEVYEDVPLPIRGPRLGHPDIRVPAPPPSSKSENGGMVRADRSCSPRRLEIPSLYLGRSRPVPPIYIFHTPSL